MPAHQLALDLPMSPAAPAMARRALDDLGLVGRERDNARLLASELVSNALRHSGAGAEAAIRLRAAHGNGVLRISVTDDGAGFASAGTRPEPGVMGGFGLFLVARLADAWGIERTTVWCELTHGLPPDATAPHQARESRHQHEDGERHDDEHAESLER